MKYSEINTSHSTAHIWETGAENGHFVVTCYYDKGDSIVEGDMTEQLNSAEFTRGKNSVKEVSK